MVRKLAGLGGLTVERVARRDLVGQQTSATALEMATPMLPEGLYRFAGQAHNGWRDRWHAVDRHGTDHHGVDHHDTERELAA